jgi:hypothetical protein
MIVVEACTVIVVASVTVTLGIGASAGRDFGRLGSSSIRRAIINSTFLLSI